MIHEQGTGIDLFAQLDSPILLHPGMRRLIPAGIGLELPSRTEAQLRAQRDMAITCGVTLLDAPYIVSPGNSDEIQVLLVNLGERGFSVKPGMAIAQMSIVSVCAPEIRLIGEIDEDDLTPIPELFREHVHHATSTVKIGVLSAS